MNKLFFFYRNPTIHNTKSKIVIFLYTFVYKKFDKLYNIHIIDQNI